VVVYGENFTFYRKIRYKFYLANLSLDLTIYQMLSVMIGIFEI